MFLKSASRLISRHTVLACVLAGFSTHLLIRAVTGGDFDVSAVRDAAAGGCGAALVPLLYSSWRRYWRRLGMDPGPLGSAPRSSCE